MGCLLCQPAEEVIGDTTVTSYADVGDIAVFSGRIIYIRIACNGLIYIKDDSLYYRTKFGASLCCKHRYKLSDVVKVEVVKQERLLLPDQKYIILNPGLKITLRKPSTTSDTTTKTMLVAIQEAERFGMELVKASGITSSIYIDLDLHDIKTDNYF